MASPKTLDFPLPPRRGSVPNDVRSPTMASFAPPPPTVSQQQQQLSRILELTNRYRTQTVALLSRQEALAAEQKQVFDLERQLWITEREIWEEERRLLTAGIHGVAAATAAAPFPAAVAAAPTAVNGDKGLDSSASVQPGQLNNTTRFLSVSSMAESTGTPTTATAMLPPPVPAPEPIAASSSVRKRDSTGGLRMNWYLKHGMQEHAANGGSIPNESVSPKGSRSGKLDSPRYAPSASDTGKLGGSISEEAGDADDEDFDIPPSLLAEATKLIYGDRPSKRGSFSSNSTATRRPVPALFKTLASDGQDMKSVRRASSSIYPSSKAARYLATFSDEDLSDGEQDEYGSTSRSTKPGGQKARKRSASQTDKPDDEPNIPLKLRPSSNFGAAFGSVSARSGGPQQQQQQQNNLAPPVAQRQGSISTSFYHPETPVDSFNSQNSFRDANWSAAASAMPKLPENSIGGDSMHSNRTVKPTVEPINVKSAPWGVTSTNITSSPTFGSALGSGLKPSPSGLTSSLSFGSSQNSPVAPKMPIPSTGVLGGINRDSDKFSTTSSRYSQDIDGNLNGSHIPPDTASGYSSHRNHKVMQNAASNTSNSGTEKAKTSPPTYTWNPPPPLPTSPTMSNGSESRKSGMYGNTILLSPSTIAPSMKTSNPRLSAVGGVMPRSTSGGSSAASPPLVGRMGTSSMLLSVSSRSEGGLSSDEDEGGLGDEIDTDEEDQDVNEIGNAPSGSVSGRVKSPELRLGGVNGGGDIRSVVKKAQRMEGGFLLDAPVEIVRDNSRWGNVLPGGMI